MKYQVVVAIKGSNSIQDALRDGCSLPRPFGPLGGGANAEEPTALPVDTAGGGADKDVATAGAVEPPADARNRYAASAPLGEGERHFAHSGGHTETRNPRPRNLHTHTETAQTKYRPTVFSSKDRLRA